MLLLLKFLVKLTHWDAIIGHKSEFSKSLFVQKIISVIKRDYSQMDAGDDDSSHHFDVTLLAIGYLFNLSNAIQIHITRDQCTFFCLYLISCN